MRKLLLALVLLAGLAGAGLFVVLRRSPLPPAPPPPAAAVPPPAVPAATVPAPQAPIRVPALMTFRAEREVPHGYDAGCEVTLHMRSLARQPLSVTGILEISSRGSVASTAPFIFQFLDPDEERSTQVGFPDCGGNQAPRALSIRDISTCKLGNAYAGNCLASAATQPGPGGFELRLQDR